MLTGVENFLGNYRNDSPLQKLGGGLRCSDTKWTFSLAGFLRNLQPRRALAGRELGDSASLTSRYLWLGDVSIRETKNRHLERLGRNSEGAAYSS